MTDEHKNEKIFAPIFTEEQITDFALKYAEKTIEKMKKDIFDDIYEDISHFVYEHYDNASGNMKRSLISNMAKNAIDNKFDGYDFKELRRNICIENLDLFRGFVNNELIEDNERLRQEVKCLEDIIRMREDFKY